VDVADQPVLDAEVMCVWSNSHKVAERPDGANGLVNDKASNGGRETSRPEAFDGAFARGRRARFGSTAAGRGSAQAAWDCAWESAFYDIELEERTIMSYIECTSWRSYFLPSCRVHPGANFGIFLGAPPLPLAPPTTLK
jgi:hypothetical protein